MILDWGTLERQVKERACQLIRTGEFHQGQPVRELLIRSISDITGVELAKIRREVEAIPNFVWAPVEAELTMLYQRCAQVVPPPEPVPDENSTSKASTGSTGLVVGVGLTLAAIIALAMGTKR